MTSPWIKSSLPNGDGTTLRVRHPAHEPWWPDVLGDYHRGELRGLVDLRSCKSTDVQSGSAGPADERFVFKRFRQRRLGDALKRFVRGSRAARALRGATLCEQEGFPTPEPHALLEVSRRGHLLYSAFVTTEVTDAPSISDWLTSEELGLDDTPGARSGLIRALARAVAAWHKAGLYHGDLNQKNVLWRRRDGDDALYWIDLERTRHLAVLPFRLRSDDLMQLNYGPWMRSMTERMRFWKTYRDTSNLSPEFSRKLLRDVVETTRGRWRKRGWL